MLSMQKNLRKCQAIPNLKRGIVVGIDVSKQKIDFAAYRPDEQSKVQTVNQNKAGFKALTVFFDDLRSAGYNPWIAFEPTGVYSTCLREWLIDAGEHVVQVNGYHVKRTKEVRDNSPEKNDSKDPRVIADLVWQGCYQNLYDIGHQYAELREAASEWVSLTKSRTALRNQFQSRLEVWFPELADIFKDSVCMSARAIVRHYDNTDAIANSKINSIKSVLRKAAGGRTLKRADAIHQMAKDSISAKRGDQACHRAMLHILDVLDMNEQRREQLRREMADMLDSVEEASYLLGIRGVGVVSVACLLGECGPLGHYATYAQLEKFVGLNLFKISSGQHKGQKHISKRGRSRARYIICQIAMATTKSGALFYDYAQKLKAEGKKTGQIRVAVARKLLKVIYALARDCKEFDPNCFFTWTRMEDGLVTHQGTQAQAA
jgi:transposase